jgi:hypothetical protein
MAAKIKSISGTPTDEKHERNLAIVERWTLVSDESGHDYVIPVYRLVEFREWNEMDTESEEFDCERFNEFRLDGGTLTFTDPKVN